MKKLVVLVSGNGSNLQAIIDRAKQCQWPAEIVGVISDRPDVYALTRAHLAGIPTQVINFKDYTDDASFQNALLSQIKAYAADYVILAGFMRILSADVVQPYVGRMLNIHPALLPKYRGLKTHARVLAAGEKIHGSTVHFVIPELDAGPMIAQSQINIHRSDTEQSLTERIKALEHELYPTVIEWLINDRLYLTDSGVHLDGKLLPTEGYQYAAANHAQTK